MKLPSTMRRREHLLLAAAACLRLPPSPVSAEPSQFQISQGVPELSNSIVASRDTNISCVSA